MPNGATVDSLTNMFKRLFYAPARSNTTSLATTNFFYYRTVSHASGMRLLPDQLQTWGVLNCHPTHFWWIGESGHVYTKRQRQCCDHTAMTLVILFSLKSMEMLENGLQTHYGALSQSCCSFDADAWCKRALTMVIAFGFLSKNLRRCIDVG